MIDHLVPLLVEMRNNTANPHVMVDVVKTNESMDRKHLEHIEHYL